MPIETDRATEIEALVRSVEAGSFSGAARLVGRTPSAISRIIARLEGRLGVRLLIRTTRTLRLTSEGEAFYRAARRILQDLDEAEQAVSEAAEPRGRLRVSAALAFGRLRVLPHVPDFLARYPCILLDVSLSDAMADLAEGQADVAIRVGDLPDSTLTARRLGESGRVIVAAPSYLARHSTPHVPEDLARHNCLGFNFRRAAPGWPFRRDGRDFELALRGNVEANSGDTVVQLAVDGVGIARVGAFHADAEIAAGRLVPLLETFNPGDREPAHALFIGGATVPARVRVFVDFLANRLARG